MLKAGVISLGCVKNLVDTEVMLGILRENKIDVTAQPNDADIIIINTLVKTGIFSISEIESQTNISRSWLSKILRRLVNDNILIGKGE